MPKFAIVTGASTGIGLELAKLALADGYDVLGVADTPFTQGLGMETLQVDLSTFEGVDQHQGVGVDPFPPAGVGRHAG